MKNLNLISKWQILILTLTTSQHALGDVNMKDGGFFKTWTDYIAKRDRRDFGRDFKIRRTYKSRSLQNGFLGYGWCMEFEKSLRRTKLGTIEIHDCASDAPIQFQSAPNLSPTKMIWKNRKHSSDIISQNGHQYIRRLYNQIIERYDDQGRLIEINNKESMAYNIKYDDTNRPKEIILSSGQRLLLTSDQQGHIEKIALKGKENPVTIAKYFYAKNNLKLVTTLSGDTYEYEYDDLHNMTLELKNNQFVSAMKYQNNRDWVVEIKDKTDCTQNFKYFTPSGATPLKYKSVLVKVCSGQVVRSAEYSLSHKMLSDGRIALDSATINVAGQITFLKFDTESGRITEEKISPASRISALDNKNREKRNLANSLSTINGELNEKLNVKN